MKRLGTGCYILNHSQKRYSLCLLCLSPDIYTLHRLLTPDYLGENCMIVGVSIPLWQCSQPAHRSATEVKSVFSPTTKTTYLVATPEASPANGIGTIVSACCYQHEVINILI